jgi:carbon-monoxide dehydrogenase medium subunit
VTAEASGTVHRPTSVEEAVRLLTDLGDQAEPLAGGTWVMRAGLRGEARAPSYVLLTEVAGLTGVHSGDPTVIGALATHRDLGETLSTDGPLGALAGAAAASAFPAVRNVATIGGNISLGARFPEADLVPALLASDASVELASAGGRSLRRIRDHITRNERVPGELLVSVHVPAPQERRSGFQRLTVRGGGEYALASVAVSVDLGSDGTVVAARVAVGAVERLARRCPAAEAVLTGRPLDTTTAEEAGRTAARELDPRDDIYAPGWYRLAVLPALLRRAVAPLADRPSR